MGNIGKVIIIISNVGAVGHSSDKGNVSNVNIVLEKYLGKIVVPLFVH